MLTFGRLVGRKIHGCDLPSWRSSYYIQISDYDYDNNDDNTFDLKYDSNDYENTIRDQGSTALHIAYPVDAVDTVHAIETALQCLHC